MSEKLAVSPEEAAALIGVSRTRIYQLLQGGELQSLLIGRRRVIRVERLNEYLQREESMQTGTPVTALHPTPIRGRREASTV